MGNGIRPKLFEQKRVGKPRLHWTLETVRHAWRRTRKCMADEIKDSIPGKYDVESEEQQRLILSAAMLYYF